MVYKYMAYDSFHPFTLHHHRTPRSLIVYRKRWGGNNVRLRQYLEQLMCVSIDLETDFTH